MGTAVLRPPMFESGGESVYFTLGTTPFLITKTSKDAMREHFEAPETAWRAATKMAAD
jgi:hypothetical protein